MYYTYIKYYLILNLRKCVKNLITLITKKNMRIYVCRGGIRGRGVVSTRAHGGRARGIRPVSSKSYFVLILK